MLATEDLRALDGDGLRRFKRVLAAAPAFPADLGALEFGFFAANIFKIPAGGWFPLLVGTLIIIAMTFE